MSRHFNMEYFEFFIELTLNNSKTWFDENRTRYEKQVRPLNFFLRVDHGYFRYFVQVLI